MKKNLLLTLLMLLISSFAYAQEQERSGTCGAQGDNLKWTYSEDAYYGTRTLVISGIGAMEDFNTQLPPWYDFLGLYPKVIIEEGVTSVGYNAFRFSDNRIDLELPSSVISLSNVLSYCHRMRTHRMKPLHLGFKESIFLCELFVPCGTIDAYIAAGWTEDVFYGGVKEASPIDYGTCGKDGANLWWVVTEDSTLTIYGQGEMMDYILYDQNIPNTYTRPWYSSYTSSDNHYCWDINKVIVEEGVTSIGDCAFSHISKDANFIDISLPNSLKSIGHSAFYGCINLKTENLIPNNVTSIGGGAFSYCESLKSIKIPNGVKSIDAQTFKMCSSLTNVQLPDGLTSIGRDAFSGCENLKSIKIPSGVTSIDGNVFTNCPNLNSIVVDSKNSVYDSRNNCNAIIETATNSLVIGCKKSVIPNSVTSIGEEAFQDCTGLTSIEIPNSVTSIGDEAFSSCTGLTSIVIPDGVTSIGDYAFSSCTGLTSIEIPNSVTSVGGYILDGTAWYDNQPDGVVYINHIAYGYKLSDEDSFWEEYEKGMELVLKEGTTCIAPGAFTGGFLQSIVIPGSVKTFESAFQESNITNVKILEGVTSISDGAFWCCFALKSIDIPSSVKTIGDLAFASCMSLKDVYCYAETVPETNAETFYDVETGNITLHVPATSIDAYKSAEPWCNFGTIVGIEEPSIEIEPISESTEMAFIIGEEIDLNSVIVNNTYFTLDAENGDGYDALQQAVVLKSTTTDEQMSVVQDAKVGDDVVRDNYNGIIFEVSAGSGTISVDAQTIGSYVLNIQIGKNKPTKVTIAERGLVEVRYNVTEPAYVYLYASSTESSAARLRNARSVAENSVLLYGYTVSLDDMNLGDGNGDGVVDISDYIGVANHILGIPQTGFNADAADVNKDGVIDISDYIGVANIILTGSPTGK